MRDAMKKTEDEEVPRRTMLDAVLDIGQERGVRRIVREQLQARFGPLPPGISERLAAANAATLQRWGLRILTATRIDEVLAD